MCLIVPASAPHRSQAATVNWRFSSGWPGTYIGGPYGVSSGLAVGANRDLPHQHSTNEISPFSVESATRQLGTWLSNALKRGWKTYVFHGNSQRADMALSLVIANCVTPR